MMKNQKDLSRKPSPAIRLGNQAIESSLITRLQWRKG